MTTPTISQIILILLPWVLLGTTYLVFRGLVKAFGMKAGYLGGFLFYWLFWCLLLPWLFLGGDKIIILFRDVSDRLGDPNWLGALFLLVPLLLGYVYAFPKAIRDANLKIVLLSFLIALVNGALEELLWRGAYLSIFQGGWFFGYVYPAVGFAIWHFAPQSVVPNKAPGGAVSLVLVAGLIGLMWAWVADQTGTILWVTVSHVLFDFSGLGARIYFRSAG